MSRYSRYPFQPAAGHGAAVSIHQTVASTHLPPPPQHQLRNPWVSGLECRESGSTNSSSASSRRGGGPWLHPLDLNHHHQPPQHQHQHQQTRQMAPHQHLYEQPIDVLGPSNALLPPPVVTAAAAVAAAAPAAPSSSRAASDRERPATPASSPGSGGGAGHGPSAAAALDGCGGHCVAFENFCYYCLQVVFVLGVLCGVSLTIAGSVLRQGMHRGRDLVVLVYIGCLLALVCAVLLAVQCCVRRNVKRRKRALRERRARIHGHGTLSSTAPAQAPAFTDLGGDVVPLQELAPAPVPVTAVPAAAAVSQYQPLLVRLVQQQQQQHQLQHIHTLPPERHHQQHRFRHSNVVVEQPLDTSRSGTPWWRRRSDFKQGVIETRH